MSPPAPPPSGSAEVAQRVTFDQIRYANCWEDSALLVDTLQPTSGRRILSIASAGDNSLHLLAHGAAVVAVDLNPAQLACVELRVAAIKKWPNENALAFLGFAPCPDRLTRYGDVATTLTPTTRAFWDAHPDWITQGIIHCGKFERYFSLFRERVMPLIHRHAVVNEWWTPRTREARTEFYENQWNTWRWRLLFRIFFSRWFMGRAGRDPQFFRYVEGSVADRIMARCRYALTQLATDQNPYLRYILTGSFAGCMPDWTQPEMLAGIRAHADRLILFQGGVEDAAAAHGADGFDGYNLSDIFEYLQPETCERLYGKLLRTARPNARLAYWNMLVPRSCPEALRDRVTPLPEAAERAFALDRAFFYSAFHVDEVRS